MTLPDRAPHISLDAWASGVVNAALVSPRVYVEDVRDFLIVSDIFWIRVCSVCLIVALTDMTFNGSLMYVFSIPLLAATLVWRARNIQRVDDFFSTPSSPRESAA